MMFLKKATKAQKWMIGAMALAFAGLLTFLVIEVVGIFSSRGEDTLSEWVWDLGFGWVIGIALLSFLTGAIFIWAGGHFLEGYGRRRMIEKGTWREEPPSE